ncbi:hypothetical protein NFI96_034401, partial [Prochilodus magdalenae]
MPQEPSSLPGITVLVGPAALTFRACLCVLDAMSVKGEQSICQARASVMIYDDTSKKWVPIKPGQQGFSRINIYHNTANNTFRVVGVKLQDQQKKNYVFKQFVVINYSIVKGLKYNQATPTFHQWRDARQVYGLNFASKEEASTFSTAMLFALNVLSSQDAGPAGLRQNGPVTDDTDAQRRITGKNMLYTHWLLYTVRTLLAEKPLEENRVDVQAADGAASDAAGTGAANIRLSRVLHFLRFFSTLQFKVSASQSDAPPAEYRQYRANTLPPSYTRLNPSPPSSCSSSTSQERESGYRTVDSSAQKKAQQLSQLSTSLASAFSPVQPGGTPVLSRNVRQIPLSPPTSSRQPDPKHGTWSSAHMYAPLPTSSPPVVMPMPLKQPVLPVALPLPPVNNGRTKPPAHFDPTPLPQQHASSQPEDCYPFQAPPPQALPPQTTSSSGGPPPHPYCYQPEPSYPAYCEAVSLPPLIGQPQVQGHAPQLQFTSSFHQQPQYQATPPTDTTPPYYTSVSEGPSTPPSLSQATSPPLPPGHPSMLSSTPPLHPPAAPMAGPPAPPPPPGPPPPASMPPPTPPPLPGSGVPAPSGLAAALAGAKLRKVQRPEESSAKNDANRSSGGSGGGGEGLMQEMNALLAR